MDRLEWEADFGERLRSLRRRARMRQRELAERVGVNANLVSDYELGKHEPTAYVVMRLARALRVSADELLGVVE